MYLQYFIFLKYKFDKFKVISYHFFIKKFIRQL